VRLETVTRDVLLATWFVDATRVASALPRDLAVAPADDGRAVVSLVALHNRDVRLAGRRVPGFAQLVVRTYVEAATGPAIFVLSIRVGAGGLPGVLFGMPLRPARLRVGEGVVRARGLGVHVRYRPIGAAPAVPVAGGVALGTHDVAYFVSAGLRRLASEHEPFRWQEAELLEPARLEPLLALGFDVREPDSLLYAESARFTLELPPATVPGPPGS
jgi:uncharacterized protein YqjF (DUF2071 family)